MLANPIWKFKENEESLAKSVALLEDNDTAA